MELSKQEIKLAWNPIGGVARHTDVVAGRLLAKHRKRKRPYTGAWMSLMRRSQGIEALGKEPTARALRDTDLTPYRDGKQSLASLARQLGFSESSLRRAWHREYGCSPSAWRSSTS